MGRVIGDGILVRRPKSSDGAPVGQLGPQEWMGKRETKAVMAALGAEGAEVRFVGGCVRDALINKPVNDVDIATPDHPETIIRLLEAAGIKAVPTGIKHGTVTAVVNHVAFEVTTLRCDIQTDGRHATVTFSGSWEEDAARRDFTMNALSANERGDVYDYFSGIEDLSDRRVRFVGRAKDRVREDRLRLLRYFRFCAHYGRPPFDKDALAACREFAPDLKQLSGERVRAEFLRLLDAPDPVPTLNVMQGEKVLHYLLPGSVGVGGLRMLVWLETTAICVDGVGCDPLRRLGALLVDGTRAERHDVTQVSDMADRLRLSRRERDRLVSMATFEFDPGIVRDENKLRGLLYRRGAEAVRDAALIDWARKLDALSRLPRAETADRTAMLETIARWRPVPFPISGRDAKVLGVANGPAMGTLLNDVETWWVDGGCRADRQACLVALEQRV